MIRLLSEGHEVGLLARTWNQADAVALAEIPDVTTYASRTSRLAGVFRAARALLFTRQSLQQAYVGSRSFKRALASATEDFQPDIVLFNVLRSAHLSDAASRTTVIDLDDVRSDYYKAMAASSSSPLWRLVARTESRRMARAELVAIEQADIVTYSSPRDVDGERNAGKGRLVRSPHSMHIGTADAHRYPSLFPIVFVGRLCYRANVEAVVWFVENVIPALVASIPDAHLYLVGEKPTEDVLRLAGPNVTVVGDVATVAPYYLGASASIVPVEMATGVQMKLIESCALGVPTVTSAVSASQAGVADGEQVIVATDPDGWVKALTRLWIDTEFAATLAQAGQFWAKSVYTDRAILESLEECLADATNSRTAPR